MARSFTPVSATLGELISARILGLRFERSLAALAAVACVGAGCCYLREHRTPEGIERWQDTTPPRLSLAEKAQAYQARLEERHQLPEGLIRYRFSRGTDEPEGSYGDLPDGPFFLGTYLASQSLRYAVTADPLAYEQVLLALNGLEILARVSGKRGLLARYVSPVRPRDDPRWRRSPVDERYFWKSDVSKDQYAGFTHGLGVALAVLEDEAVLERVRRLAAEVADHLIENDLRIIDWDGRRTTHGSLRGRFLCIPLAVNGLIAMGVAKVAAATGESRYLEFYRRLLEYDYPQLVRSAHFSVFGIGKRVNDNMGYLALYPLLLLERDPATAAEIRAGARRTWRHVRGDRNAFFSFVHAAVVEAGALDAPPPRAGSLDGAREVGIQSLLEFPDTKIAWPVDLTREGFDFPRAFLNTPKCRPRSTVAIPPYLRVRSSSLWASDPFRLVGRLQSRGDTEYAGIDYLIAYWIGRYHGFILPGD